MEVTRKQIYDMIWTEGIGKTEKELGLKYDELKAICDKFDIPRPTSGYWSSLKFGRPAHKAALEETKEDSVLINTDAYIRKKKCSTPPKKEPVVKEVKGKYPPRELPSDEGNIVRPYLAPNFRG